MDISDDREQRFEYQAYTFEFDSHHGGDVGHTIQKYARGGYEVDSVTRVRDGEVFIVFKRPKE